MLARKIQCPSCGANKINDIKTGYIYCDYCASYMGYDFEKVQEEASNIFDSSYFMEHGKWPDDVQAYMDTGQAIASASKERNNEAFIEASMKMRELDIQLFPERFSPKMKNATYRESFLKYFRKLLNDQLADNYFDKNEAFVAELTELQSKIKMNFVDHKSIWEYDENVEAYFDCIRNYYKATGDSMLNYPSSADYPEPINPNHTQAVFKQSINFYTNYLDEEGFNKLLDYLDLKTEYIDIQEPQTKKDECAFCGSPVNIPEGSEKLVCDACGNTNSSTSNEIECVNCGAPFEPNKETNACPYCDSRIGI